MNFLLPGTKINLECRMLLLKNYLPDQFSLGGKTVFIKSPRENVNRKRLESIWWNVKNYIFGISND